jgi:O-antigen ligase
VACPFLLLLFRSFGPGKPIALPNERWLVLTGAMAGSVLLSAIASPYRGPSVLWSAVLLAGPAAFLALHDWLQAGERRLALLRTSAGILTAAGCVSAFLWLRVTIRQPDIETALEFRNPFPLGHSNYTAGIGLLLLPCAGYLALRCKGWSRVGWALAAILAGFLIITSASRGGLLGLAVLAACTAFPIANRLKLRRRTVVLAALVGIAAVLTTNPRLTNLLRPRPPEAMPDASVTQREGMLRIGWMLGRDRPLTGWGPGTVPLAYPRYRAEIERGVDNVLQLHSSPVHVWAILGAPGILMGLAAIALALAGIRRKPAGSAEAPTASGVLLGVSGYAVLCLTDWQLDVPVFTFALAAALALVASAEPVPTPTSTRRSLPGYLALATLAVFAIFARRDPTPALNVGALSYGRGNTQELRAIALLQESIQLNPDQEIVHFNLGWLLVVRDPPQAERHFLAAARLDPDRVGTCFGIGLSRLNQGRTDDALRAFSIAALNDPVFLVSPWWRAEPFASIRRDRPEAFLRLAEEVRDRLQDRGDWVAREARYNAALFAWILGRGDVAEMLRHSFTDRRVAFFSGRPELPDFDSAPINVYRRQRSGYPVLMRQPSLAVPSDLFDVQENALATGELRFAFPERGWVPSPLLLELLDAN